MGSDYQINFQMRHLGVNERMLLLQLLRFHDAQRLFARHVRQHNLDMTEALCRFLDVRLTARFPRLDRDLSQHTREAHREQLYLHLLRAGAPKKMLQSQFAKNAKIIEYDRASYNMAFTNQGRPPKLDIQLAYELAGRWEILRIDNPDFAECMLQLHMEYPSENLASIFSLVIEL